MDPETLALARRIFEILRNADEPYAFNPDPENLTIGVDGYLDCRELATALIEQTKTFP